MKNLLTATAIGAMLAAGVAIAMQTGTPADTAPKKPVTKAEMLQRADARFDRMDTNKDGQLDAAERKAGAEAARAAMAERKGGEMADFMPGGGRGGRMGARMEERMLGRVDTNGDGLISKAENRAAAETRFARMDANGDGTIAADERGKGMGKWKRGRGGEEGARRDGPRSMGHGMKADANGDGVITRAEFDAQNAARFAAMDANKDGKIDQSEMPQPRRKRGMTPATPDTPQGE